MVCIFSTQIEVWNMQMMDKSHLARSENHHEMKRKEKQSIVTDDEEDPHSTTTCKHLQQLIF